MDPLVSIIVPAYNAEKYIGECLDSLISQTYKNLQIIVVDDGSVDGTPKILDAYAEKDSRIEVIHKANGGVATARNMALDAMKGQYVHFCDADDWMSPNVYEVAVKRIRSEKVDFMIMNSYVHNGDEKPELRTLTLPEGKYNKIALLKYSCGVTGRRNRLMTCFLSVTNKVFDASLFFKEDGTPIRFKEGMKYLEDGRMLIDLFGNIKTGYYDERGFYHIRKNEESAMGKLDIAALSEQMLNGYNSLLESDTVKNNHVVRHFVQNAYSRAAFYYLRTCLQEQLDDAAEQISKRFAEDEEFQLKYQEYYEKIKQEREEACE